MELNTNNLSDERDDQTIAQQPVPNTRNDGTREVREGQPAGGHKFGEDGNPTPMGDDKDNPSRNAGYTNAYFARTAPSDEDTANNNFKAAHQEGEPDYAAAQHSSPDPDEEEDNSKRGPDTDLADIEPGLDEPQPDHGAGGTETGSEQDHIET